MSDLPDYKKIEFPDMPPIPLEEVVPDASPEVSNHCASLTLVIKSFSYSRIENVIWIIITLTCEPPPLHIEHIIISNLAASFAKSLQYKLKCFQGCLGWVGGEGEECLHIL